jgi:proteasome lid subunit RPN8/RPN11
MSIEAAVVIGKDGEPLLWHTPNGCGPSRIPDSRDLWLFLWENRDEVLGIAHTHPGSGYPSPSYEDVTTFAAIESGLGRRLVWWILTSDETKEFCWKGPEKYEYRENHIYSQISERMEPASFVELAKKHRPYLSVVPVPEWVEELRGLSYHREPDLIEES